MSTLFLFLHPLFLSHFRVQLDTDIQDLIKKFSEHYHDAWASRKLENGWVYGETYSIEEKLHPRLKPYNMLSDYVSIVVILSLPQPLLMWHWINELLI